MSARRRARLGRYGRLASILAGLLVVLAVGALLARVLGAKEAERAAVVELVRAQARGDAAAVVARLTGCRTDRRCRADVGAGVVGLRRAGAVEVLNFHAADGFPLGAGIDVARVAWRTASTRPVVQCVRLRRTGDLLRGLRVEPVALGPPIAGDAGCPGG